MNEIFNFTDTDMTQPITYDLRTNQPLPVKNPKSILLNTLEVLQGAQIRQSEHCEKIQEYAEVMADGWGAFPEIKVCLIDGQYHIADGHHRWKAAKQAGLKEIPCLVVGETETELWEHAFSENVNKGIVMTDEEKREVYKKAILKFPDKSARQIAEMCRCPRATIDRMKKKLEQDGVYKRPEMVIGKNGVIQKAKHAISGGSSEPPEKSSSPSLSLTPPAALAGYVICRQCGETQLEEMTQQPDTTWRQKGLDENGKYRWLCSDDCEDKWNEAQAQALDDELAQQNAEPMIPIEMKPPKLPESCILQIGLVCEVQGETDASRAFLEVQENLPLILAETQFKVKKNSIYNNINITNINNIYTGNSREEKTEFTFNLKGGKCHTLGKSKLEEYKVRYPTLDVESVMRDCMNWNNDGSGSALVPFQKLYQRINNYLMGTRDRQGNEAKGKVYSNTRRNEPIHTANEFSSNDYD